jgi:predicted AAA+ superfamily ATPase
VEGLGDRPRVLDRHPEQSECGPLWRPTSLLPIPQLEVGPTPADRDRLWLRGGFPESFLASSHARSLRWRLDFIRSYLERDIPQLGPRIAADRLRTFWTMLAHHQGGVLNVAQLARNLGVDAKTAGSYIDPGDERYRLNADVEAIPLLALARLLTETAR